jgi:carbon starvation protein
MDTGVRLQRYIVQEIGTIYRMPVLTGRGVATFVAVASCVALAFGAGGGAGTGGLAIWPLFGTTNQLLAGLTLLVMSVFLMKLGRPTIFTLAPFVFLVTMTVLALLVQLAGFWRDGRYFLVFTDLLILLVTIWASLEAIAALRRAKQERDAGTPSSPASVP